MKNNHERTYKNNVYRVVEKINDDGQHIFLIQEKWRIFFFFNVWMLWNCSERPYYDFDKISIEERYCRSLDFLEKQENIKKEKKKFGAKIVPLND